MVPTVRAGIHVPGDTGTLKNSDRTDHPHILDAVAALRDRYVANHPGERVQLFLGIDGLNLWLVAAPRASCSFRPSLFHGTRCRRSRARSSGCCSPANRPDRCFLSFDVILFYVFFELTLIPAFFLIGR